MYEAIITTSRYILAILLLTSAYDKSKNYHHAISSIKGYQLIPEKWNKLVLIIGVILEFYIGVSLLIENYSFLPFFFFSVMMITYTVAIFLNLYKGNTAISCGCGGVLESEELSYNHLLRNFSLIVISYFVYKYSNQLKVEWAQSVFMFLIASSFVIFYGAMKEFARQISTIKKIRSRLPL